MTQKSKDRRLANHDLFLRQPSPQLRQSNVRLLRTRSSCAASAYCLYPPNLAGLILPVSRSSRRNRPTELRLTPNRSAASSRVAPCSISSTTRARKSSEYGLGIHAGLLPSEELESYSCHHGNPSSIQPFRKML